MLWFLHYNSAKYLSIFKFTTCYRLLLVIICIVINNKSQGSIVKCLSVVGFLTIILLEIHCQVYSTLKELLKSVIMWRSYRFFGVASVNIFLWVKQITDKKIQQPFQVAEFCMAVRFIHFCRMAFLRMSILQGSVARRMGHLIMSLLQLNLQVREFWKSFSIWLSWRQKYNGTFFETWHINMCIPISPSDAR